ncbi:hypothetical protein ABZV94_36470, partial [Streptomyces sp. NPDC004658]
MNGAPPGDGTRADGDAADPGQSRQSSARTADHSVDHTVGPSAHPSPAAAASPQTRVPSWEDLVTTALLGTDRRAPAHVEPGRPAPVVEPPGLRGVLGVDPVLDAPAAQALLGEAEHA